MIDKARYPRLHRAFSTADPVAVHLAREDFERLVADARKAGAEELHAANEQLRLDLAKATSYMRSVVHRVTALATECEQQGRWLTHDEVSKQTQQECSPRRRRHA